MNVQTLEKRNLLAASIATIDGDWSDPAIWSNGVPNETTPAIVGHGVAVQLDGKDHAAETLVIHGDLIVPEDTNPAETDKTLRTRWVHVNSGGEFIVGSEADRYDNGSFTLTLTGTDVESDHIVPTNMMGMNPDSINIKNNDGFLMTGGMGRIQFYGENKLSFTKIAATADAESPTITVANVIERNFNTGAMDGDDFVTSATDDGELNWEVGDKIVVASSSYDYTEEDVRIITAIVDNGDDTSTLTLDAPLDHRHYGEIEVYGTPGQAAEGTTPSSQTYSIDMRAEVALLSRNVKVQGLESQDTDVNFGDRANVEFEPRVRAGGLSDVEAAAAPGQQVANGVGGHIMIMPDSGSIAVDGVQLDHMGQSSQKGRYPIHWHLGGDRGGDILMGGDRPQDILKNTSITNSNNRGVTIHGTSNLRIEGVVLHDVHGHGFFFEDAVETGNELIANLAIGIHAVGGNDANFLSPGTKDPFIVDTHDSVLETGSRFSNSAAFWITNPTNTFVGNIAAGAGDIRPDAYAVSERGVSAGTGFWFALPRTALGLSEDSGDFDHVQPIFAEFGQFDYNTSHTTAVGLNFDRGSDIEDAHFDFDNVDFNSIQGTNEYSPRSGSTKAGDSISNTVTGFTNYKASDAAFYHRGDAHSIQLDGLRIADSYNGPWAVSENNYDNTLFVGHSRGNADFTADVGGPRLYDGAGLYTNTHFAGFADEDASVFQVEGSSFGPTMYHAFRGSSFEADGTYDHVAHAVSDFEVDDTSAGHDLGQPSRWIKGVIDFDGTLTGGVGGGVGHSIVANVDFLVDEAPFLNEAPDVQPEGWDAWITDDLYTRVRISQAPSNGQLFPSDDTGEPLVRFTARDGDFVDVMTGQNTDQESWTQVAAKAESDGFVDGTLTVEFMRNGLPNMGFVIHTRNQDNNLPDLVPEIQANVDAARIVVKVVGAGNYVPSSFKGISEVASETELRAVTSGLAYFSDDEGNLFLNTDIASGWSPIELAPGAPLQTAFAENTVAYGSSIQATNFDNGINGIAYNDSDSVNTFGTYRTDTAVDASPSAIGNLADGEWLEYTANITSAGYNIGLNVASTAAGGQIRVLAANSNSAGYLRELGIVEVPNTGGEIQQLLVESVDLDFAAGTDSVIRLEFVGDLTTGNVTVESMDFSVGTQTSFVPGRTITADLTQSTIELEEFDLGGQGIAYYDDSPGNANQDNAYRTDEDVETTTSGVSGEVFEGEWLEYTTDIEAGIYDIALVRNSGGDDTGVRLLIGESNSDDVSNFDVVRTLFGGTESLTATGVDLTPWAGTDRVIRVEVLGRYMGLDKIEFTNTAGPTQTDIIAPTADIVDVTPDPRNTGIETVIVNFDEDVRGFDIEDVTLTRDGAEVSLAGASVTQITPSRYRIDLASAADQDGDYELTLQHANSGIADLVGNALAADAVDQFLIDGTGPQVESVVVNDGSAQRSMVSQLTVNFSEQVVGVDSGSFLLMNTTTNTQVVPTVSTELVDGRTVATLTFSGAGIIGGSLADGNYTLTTLASGITDVVGNQLDGNADGVGGDDTADSFFRYFGDADGDGDVDARDFLQFRSTFRRLPSEFAFKSAMDFDGDGDVDARDFRQFRLRYRTSILN